ncbi:hypothetical protein FBU59_002212 [Linderina macrospora]|uniref:Uncharacterized protein n=1 Tax=Linderina macrospora TaxID=4868 RepID=A0ACC1JBT8_9FUNG|nr:hypothetical protein FBU59_002212 [Linderina macrospora]
MTAAADEMQFVVTAKLQQACKDSIPGLPKTHAQRKEIARIAKATLSADTETAITLASVKAVSQHLLSQGSDAWIHTLLRGSCIYIEKPKPKPRNPELEARLAKISRMLEEQEYKKMTDNVQLKMHEKTGGDNVTNLDTVVPGVRAGVSAGPISAQQEMKEVNRQISVIANILFSALGVGFAVFYASYTLTSELGFRILLGLASAIVIAAAEAWLFAFSGSRGQKKRLAIGTTSKEPAAKKWVAPRATAGKKRQ